MYYKLRITETGCNSPKDFDNSAMFNLISENFKTIEEVKTYLEDRYEKFNPKTCRKMYRDGADGKAIESGYIKSYWNKDWSHNSKNWWQTDWIEITTVEEANFLL